MEQGKSKPTFKKTRPWRFDENTETAAVDQIEPSLTRFNPVKSGFEDRVKPSLTKLNQVTDESLDPIKPSLTQFKNLHGNPKKVLAFLSISISDFRKLITKELPLSAIAKNTNLSKDSVKSALKFLLRKNIINRVDFFAGIRGWAQYSIEENAFSFVQNNTKTEFNPVLETGSISSSSNLNTTTELDDTVQEIDISSLEGFILENKKPLGLTKAHIKQIFVKSDLSKEEVQYSVCNFAFDLKNTKKWKLHDNPLLPFMGSLTKGVPWTAENYVSPRETALRKRLEAEKRLQTMEDEMFEIEFRKWINVLSEDQKKSISPDKLQFGQLHSYFRTNVWPEIKQKSEVL